MVGWYKTVEAEECCTGRKVESVGCVEMLYGFRVPSAEKSVMFCGPAKPQMEGITYANLHDRGKAVSCKNFAHLTSKTGNGRTP